METRQRLREELADAERTLAYFEERGANEELEIENRRRMAMDDVKSRIKELEDELVEGDD